MNQQYTERKYVRPLTTSGKKPLSVITNTMTSPKVVDVPCKDQQEQKEDHKQMTHDGHLQINHRLKDLIFFKQNIIVYHNTQDQQILQQLNQLSGQYQVVSQEQQQYINETRQSIAKFEDHMNKVHQQNLLQLEIDENILNERLLQQDEIQQTIIKYDQVVLQSNSLKDQIFAKEQNLKLMQEKRFKVQQDTLHLQNEMRERSGKVLELQNDTKQLINQQRILNNELQESKGNIRVYCRVRPLLQGEDINQVPCVTANGECSILLSVPKNYHKSENFLKSYSFNFEHIFEMQTEQNTIYAELSQLIENVIDGHNVCIFAYGQTGSGKTFTMQGLESFEKRGVIPRAVEHIFNEIKNQHELGWVFKIRIGFQEIYNETIRDLLTNQKTDDILLTEVNDQVQVYDLFRRAMDNRKVAETQCNEFSSRSHFIFQLNLCGTNIHSSTDKSSKIINGTLNLIDLAGSERLNVAKTEGDRLKETQCINKSLTALSDVINALAQKSQFVPYRNSKLTHMLQKQLEGSSKTLMLVNISPRLDDFSQTLQSLRFAEKVKSCKAGNQVQQQMKT